MLRRTLLATAITTLLAGCSSDNDDNIVPTVSLSASSEVAENTTFSIDANASDEDGSISSTVWSVDSGPVSIDGDGNGNSVSLIADAVDEDATAVVSVIVTDDDGDTASSQIEIDIVNTAPSITLEESFSGKEKSDIVVSADIELESGSIASATWSTPDGSPLTLSNESADSVTVTLPEVQQDMTSELYLTVIDDDGDEVRASTTIEIVQNTLPLSLSGLATDAPLANATISILVDGNVIRDDITTNQDGEFNATLVLDDSQENGFLSIKAKGSSEQPAAGLMSLVANVADLIELSEDGQVSRDKVEALTVTNITTARYALMKRAAGEGVSVHDKDVVKELSTAISNTEMLRLATAIKVAIDMGSSPDTQLPDGVEDTLGLLENMEVAASYVETVEQTPEYETAQQEIFNDPELIASDFNFPESFELYETFSDGLRMGAQLYRFNADGTGSLAQQKFNWTKDGATLRLTFIDPFTASYRLMPGYDSQVFSESGIPESELTLLYADDGTLDLWVESTQVTRYPDNPELETVYVTSDFGMTAKIETTPFSLSPPQTVYLPLPGSSNYFIGNVDGTLSYTGYDEFTLSADGTLTGKHTGMNTRYRIVDGKLLVEAEPNEASSLTPSLIEYSYLGESSDLASFIAMSGRDAENNILTPMDGVDIGFLKASDTSFTPENVVGVYGYETNFFDSVLNNFWWELLPNGDANTYSTQDRNEDGELSDDEVSLYTGTWRIDDEGKVIITRFVDAETDKLSSTCRSESQSCILYNDRGMKLLAADGEKLLIEHSHLFYDSNWGYDDELTLDLRPIRKWDEPPLDISGIMAANEKAVSQIAEPETR